MSISKSSPPTTKARSSNWPERWCREHLRSGLDFAFNATNIIRQTRKRWIDLFADYGARVELVYLEPPLPLIFARNARRPRPVPTRVIERMVDRLEPPTRTEAHSLTMIVDHGSPWQLRR